MRTQEEILGQIEKIKDDDFFGVAQGRLIEFLNFDNAKTFLKEGAKKSEWEERPNNKEEIKAQMEDYLEFAWGKANGFRGLSASRSMDHYGSLIWLLNDKDLNPDFDNYEFYGKDILTEIGDYLGVNNKIYDDGVRLNSEPY